MLTRIIYRIIAGILLLLLLPVFFILFLVVKLSSSGPFIFRQQRLGRAMEPFTIYKIRTMIFGAESLQSRLLKQNERDGPLFKIRNDPRFTSVGMFLSHTGIDELPQLVNIVKGEMTFVGPRPFNITSSRKIPSRYHNRFSVLPGITSPWFLRGEGKNSFNEWMRSDLEYVNSHTFTLDCVVVMKTLKLLAYRFFIERWP